MIHPELLSTVIAKLSLGVAAVFGVIFAIGEASSDRTLIVLAIVGSVTTVLVSLVSAIVSIYNSRKLSKVAELPAAVHELRINLDGRMQELMETKEKAAHSAGAEQERTEERDRQGVAATAVQAASPTPVVIEQPENKPVIVKPVK